MRRRVSDYSRNAVLLLGFMTNLTVCILLDMISLGGYHERQCNVNWCTVVRETLSLRGTPI